MKTYPLLSIMGRVAELSGSDIHQDAQSAKVERSGDGPMQLPEQLGRPLRLAGMPVKADRPEIAEAVNEHGLHAALTDQIGKGCGSEVIEMKRRMVDGSLWRPRKRL